ncbi:hypothetical protein M408DRAFT_327371 [Serendipita vermifera MAFF 305830]|uniref:Nucleoside transporter n=1 Tax=Serendipita vermifera MAFF 305830 TaxID=933852 RepID=A0A0C2X150_SERVB|nr:hypothetical protein M408DRAFT_327371 [Serendipita vermifera MAFF 305830]
MNDNASPIRTRRISLERDADSSSAHTGDTKATTRIYRIFFILGAAVLLPWNAMITTFPYSLERLEGSTLRPAFASYFSAIYQLASFAVLCHASYTSAHASKHQRITLAYLWITLTLVLLFCSTFTPSQPTFYFIFIISIGALQASAGNYFLISLVAFASYFGPLAMQSIMSGQAAIAVVVSVVQLITTLSTLGSGKPTKPSNTDEPGMTSTAISAFYFYLISTVGIVSSYFVYRYLTRMSAFKRTVARFEGAKVVDSIVGYQALPEDDPTHPAASQTDEDDENTDLMAMSTSIGSLREREREMDQNAGGLDGSISSLQATEVERGPGTMGEVEPVTETTFWAIWKVNSMYNIAVILIYITTLAIYPAVTSSVKSVNPGANPQIFTSIHFIVFNVADWIGRIICSYPRFQIWSRKRLLALSAFRSIFIVLFLACNIDMSPPASVPHPDAPSAGLSLLLKRAGPPLINSDFVFFALLVLFGLSNGWLTSLIMMAAPSLEHNKRMRKEWVDLAAVSASFSLVAGLVLGSITNFALRGMVCKCNPFIQ